MTTLPLVLGLMCGGGGRMETDRLLERYVPITGEITGLSTIEAIGRINSFIKEDSSKPITLLINSSGGCARSTLGFLDYLQTLETPIYSMVIGMAMSSAFILLTSGMKGYRYASKNSLLMMHSIRDEINAPVEDTKVYVKMMTDTQRLVINKLCDTTGLDMETVEDKFMGSINNYFTVDEGLELGVVDVVL